MCVTRLKNLVNFKIIGFLVLFSCQSTIQNASTETKPEPEPAPVYHLSGLLRGTITSDGTFTLPESAYIIVQLVQLKNDMASEAILAKMRIPQLVSPSISFEMRYSPKSIDPRHNQYGLIAEVYVWQRVQYSTEKPCRVFQKPGKKVEIAEVVVSKLS